MSHGALRKAEAVIESVISELATVKQQLEEANSLFSRLREEVASLGNSKT